MEWYVAAINGLTWELDNTDSITEAYYQFSINLCSECKGLTDECEHGQGPEITLEKQMTVELDEGKRLKFVRVEFSPNAFEKGFGYMGRLISNEGKEMSLYRFDPNIDAYQILTSAKHDLKNKSLLKVQRTMDFLRTQKQSVDDKEVCNLAKNFISGDEDKHFSNLNKALMIRYGFKIVDQTFDGIQFSKTFKPEAYGDFVKMIQNYCERYFEER